MKFHLNTRERFFTVRVFKHWMISRGPFQLGTDYLRTNKDDPSICSLLCCTEEGKSHLLLFDGEAEVQKDEMTCPNYTASWWQKRECAPGHS